jgi:hypothetical protein
MSNQTLSPLATQKCLAIKNINNFFEGLYHRSLTTEEFEVLYSAPLCLLDNLQERLRHATITSNPYYTIDNVMCHFYRHASLNQR